MKDFLPAINDRVTALNYIIYGIIAYSVFGIIDSLSSVIGMASAFSGEPSIGFSGIIFNILILGGYVLYFWGISNLSKTLDEKGNAAVKNIKYGLIIGIVALLVDIIPLLGIVVMILEIISIIFLVLGYKALKTSDSLDEQGKSGASLLFIAILILLICWVIDFIPVVGGIIESIGEVVAFILVLMGWLRIKKSQLSTPQDSITE